MQFSDNKSEFVKNIIVKTKQRDTFMFKNLCAFMFTCIFISQVHAQVGVVNPMSPRQTSVQNSEKSYNYGYSLLAGSAIDSLERANRGGFYLNYDIFDSYVLRPVAHGYAALPVFVQDGVGNFLTNIDDVTSTVDNIFVLRFKDALTSLSRVLINSTIGIGGLFDVAGSFGIERKPMSMATVFGIWGQQQGPYLMIPVYGPTTGRALQGNTIDSAPFFFTPWYVNAVHFALSGIHARAALIEQEGLVDNAIDPYVQTRDFYLMYQQGQVNKAMGIDAPVLKEENLDDEFLDEIDG